MHSPILSSPKRIASHPLFIPLVLLAVMAAGFWVRFDDVQAWREKPDQAFYQGRPLLATYDGYFYLSLSRDLLRGEYDSVDEKRVVPVGGKRPYPPPLLSVLAAVATKITGASLDMVGTVMPAFLGVLLAIPLYLLGNCYGGRVMGLTAAFASLFSPYYVYRSNVGWFDTDCLNVTFAMFMVFWTLQFALQVGRLRYLYGIAALICYLLFLWWWDQAFAVVSVLFFAPALIALLIFYRPTKREGWIFYAIVGVLLGLLLLAKGISLPQQIWHAIEGYYNYIYTSKTVVDVFPNQSISVSEQVRPGFREIVAISTGSMLVFLAACAGLLSIFYRRPKESLFLVVPLILASFSFLFAERFLIFLNPMIALGLGGFIYAIWMLRKRYAIAALLAPLCAFVLLWPNVLDNVNRVYWPKVPSAFVAGMAAAETLTPKDAVIWTWWDHGYNMRYWSDRAVVADGSHHGGDVSLYNALPLTVASERLSANFMHFYAQRGQQGLADIYKAFGRHEAGLAFLKTILTGGPEGAEDILGGAKFPGYPAGTELSRLRMKEFYFPAQKKPVYLFLDRRLTITSDWWYWFGSWNFDKQEGTRPFFEFFEEVDLQNNMFVGRGSWNSFQADLLTGITEVGNSDLLLAKVAVFAADGKVQVKRFKNMGPDLEVSQPTRSAVIVDSAMGNSVFNKLFVRRQYDQNYFELVDEAFPDWQLWKVTGDQ